MKLKRQGFYKEMPHGRESDLSIQKFVREKGDAEEDKIYQYLQGRNSIGCMWWSNKRYN